jgi:hypothetical protein
MQDGAGCDDAGFHSFDAKSFEGMCLKMPEQAFGGEGFFEQPAFQGIGIEFTCRRLL